MTGCSWRGGRYGMGQRAGFVLVCVLWVTALLSLLALGFARRAMLDRRAATYALDHAVAMAAARGAVERGILEVMNRGLKIRFLPPERRGGTHLGEYWARPTDFAGEGFLSQELFGEGDAVYYVIADEERRININTAPEELLRNIPSLNRTVLRRILARRSGQDEEDPENRVTVFRALEELRSFRGVEDEDWFGDDRKPGLSKLLTVWGDGMININTASREVLMCIPGIQEQDVDAWLSFRAGDDRKLDTEDDRGVMNLDDLTRVAGIQGKSLEAIRRFCKVDSTCFKISGLATRRNGRVRAFCSAVVTLSEDGPVIVDWQEKPIGS
ncbi:MAG TPA: type II secretion system protein GspK [Candidatus Hydrogenedentes bacterium]|nr:type II secretion system protein GspK [Candidatus Hydrogenedentota bacterium]HOK89435.1 type II secretion system protein GspK [Candidatus Hydrogenedentota bacterium]